MSGAAALEAAVVSIFPEMFDALTGHGVVGRAHEAGSWRLHTVNPRQFAIDRHRSVDDRPFGGGPGMLMAGPQLAASVVEARRQLPQDRQAKVVVLSPQGKPAEQADVARLSQHGRVVFVCGRYEGMDERFIARYCDEELSLGDFVMSGGEIAAMALLDAMVRLGDGVLNTGDSAVEDSFAAGSAGLLDCPHYTRPVEFEGEGVPGVLLGGDHAAIEGWRRGEAMQRSLVRRPELVERRRREGRLTGPLRRALNAARASLDERAERPRPNVGVVE